MKKYIFFVILLLAVFVAALPLLGKAYIPTHDGEYHIIRIVEFSRMLSQGNIVPRWAPTLNSGYGIPIFEFHYPLPNYIGAGIRLFTRDAVYAFQIMLALGYIAASIGCYFWLSSLFGSFYAMGGSIISAFVPYWFVDMYVRGSVGEIWAIACVFFLGSAIERKQYIGIMFSYAFLILSHNILAMVFTPIMFLYLWLKHKTIKPLLAGLGLSAFFWLPALIEKRYVVGLNTVNVKEHFVALYELLVPSWGTAFSGSGFSGNKISFQIGIIPLIVLFGSAYTYWRHKQDKFRIYVMSMLAFCFVCIIFMLPISTIFWTIITPLQVIQYPWRLLSFFIPAVGFLSAYWMSKLKKPYLVVILACLAIIFSISYTRKVFYEPRNEAYYLSRSNFTDGTSSMGNSFSTIWTGWKEARPQSEFIIQNGKMTNKGTWSYTKKQFNVEMDNDGVVTMNTIYFPGWTVYVDKRIVPILKQTDGIIHFMVTKGKHNIVISYNDTPARMLGNIVSILCLVGIIVWGILAMYEDRNRHITNKK